VRREGRRKMESRIGDVSRENSKEDMRMEE
jgi:hypothetical protein